MNNGMNQQLSIHTLGGARVEVGQATVTKWQSRKAEALLIYLATTRRTQKRESLVGLLWAEMPQERALANLSVMLSNIRKNVGAGFLLSDRQQVGLDWNQPIWVDVDAFTTKMGELLGSEPLTRHKLAQLEKSLVLYQGDFLQGYYIRGAHEFEEWRLFEQERLRQMAINGWQALVSGYLRRGEGNAGIPHAQKLLTLDPLRENTHRDLMQLYAIADQRAAAIEQYEKCRQILDEELGVEPEAETITLFEQIKAGEQRGKEGGEKSTPPLLRPSPSLHNLLTPLTPFIGREVELRYIRDNITQPNCRWLTLVGQGGSGKTRLALAAGHMLKRTFIDGIWFVSLTDLDLSHVPPETAPDLFATIIGEVLPFSFSGIDAPFTQLLDYLKDREMLLILDNFEHLVSLRELPSRLLAHAPDLKLLITSRERLTQQGEWMLEIGGLTLPATPHTTDWLAKDAVQLFTQTGVRHQPEFDPSQQADTVYQICHLLGGIPLALELAAGWLPIYSCRQIADEIKKSLTFLQAVEQNVPNRHQSLQVVFDHSWQLLSAEEQAVFQRLAVFRGGFTMMAAGEVAGISPLTLRALFHKSLIQRSASDRFDLHSLIRQLTVEKLGQDKAELRQTVQKHADYYSRWLVEQGENEQLLLLEMGNLEKTWEFGVNAGNWQLLQVMFTPFMELYYDRSLFQGGETLCQQTLASIHSCTIPISLKARLLAKLGKFQMRLAKLDIAKTTVQQSLKLIESENLPSIAVELLELLGTIESNLGNYETALSPLQKGLKIARQQEDEKGVCTLLNSLGNLFLDTGEYDQAESCFLESLALAKKIGSQKRLAILYNGLGILAVRHNQYDEARNWYQQSLQSAQARNHLWGIAVASINLGLAFNHLEEYEKAESYIGQAKEQYVALGDRRGLMGCTASLGLTQLNRGNLLSAKDNFREALRLAMGINARGLALCVLVDFGRIALKLGNLSQAVELFAFCLEQSATDGSCRHNAETLLAELKAEMPASDFDMALQTAQALSFEKVCAQVLTG